MFQTQSAVEVAPYGGSACRLDGRAVARHDPWMLQSGDPHWPHWRTAVPGARHGSSSCHVSASLSALATSGASPT